MTLLLLSIIVNGLTVSAASGQQNQQWLTYTNPEFRYSIQYPSDWEFEEASYLGGVTSPRFGVPEKYSFGYLIVAIRPVEMYLEHGNLTLKTRTSQDYVRDQISDINSDPNLKLNKNISTTIGQNHYPAFQLHFVRSDLEYHINTVMVNGGYVYDFVFAAPSPDIPELLPTVEKMLASFQITE